MKTRSKTNQQVVALPWQLKTPGERQVMLIPARHSRRRVIPKAILRKRQPPFRVAARAV